MPLFEELDFRNVKVTEFIVRPTSIQYVRNFVEKWHYSTNVNGLRIAHVFGLYYDGNLIGAMIYGPLAMACLLYTSPSPRDKRQSRMPSSA